MAEVKINIYADDKATPVLRQLETNTTAVANSSKQLDDNFKVAQASIGAAILRIIDWAARTKFLSDLFQNVKKHEDEVVNKDIANISKYLEETLKGTHNLINDTENMKREQIELASILPEALKDYSLEVEDANRNIKKATEVLEKFVYVADQVAQKEIKVNLEGISKVETALTELDVSLQKDLTLNVAQAIRAAEVVKKVLKAIPDSVDRTLTLDVSQALAAVGAVKGAIDAIPDVTYKTVIVQYLTQASPVRPFTEGMKYIRAEMESLPSEGTYTVRFGGTEAGSGGMRAPSSGAGTRDVTFSPTIYINGAAGREGRELAGEIDRALAEKWRYNRSELRRAMAI